MVINKGNYGIDTPERFEKYMEARAYGNRKAFFEYRKNWAEYPVRRYVSEYPLSLEFQISDVCNLKCPMCYRSQSGYAQESQKFMEFAVFKRAIDETAWKVPAIRFNSSGESVLHPQFIEMVKYAKDHGAIEVSFITNAGTIGPELFEKLLLAGVDWMTVSVDGIYEEYEKIRYPLKFQELYEKLSDMREIKRRYLSPKPAINVQGVWPMIEKDIEKYIELMTPVSDYINYNAYIDMEKLYDDCFSEAEPEFTCAQPYQRLLIQMNGNVLACCGATTAKEQGIVGNVTESSVYEIWHGDRLSKIRELCSVPGGYKKLEMCRKCAAPHKILEKTVKILGNDYEIRTEYV